MPISFHNLDFPKKSTTERETYCWWSSFVNLSVRPAPFTLCSFRAFIFMEKNGKHTVFPGNWWLWGPVNRAVLQNPHVTSTWIKWFIVFFPRETLEIKSLMFFFPWIFDHLVLFRRFWGLRGCHLAPAEEENALDPDDEDSRAVRAEMASRSELGRRKTALESFLDADAWRIGLDRGVLGNT